MISIRRALQQRLVITLVLLLGAAGLALWLYLRRLLVSQFDAGLEARARLLAAMVKLEPDEGLETEFEEAWLPEYQPGPSAEYFELRLPDGRPQARSPSLGSASFPGRPPGDRPLAFWDLRLPDGRSGRAVALAFGPPAIPLTLVAARERRPLDAALRGVMTGLALLAAALLVGILATVGRAVRRGLRPLDQLADRVSAIDAADLRARLRVGVSPESLPAELQPIVGRLDDLLDRLGAAFERERRFSADVAHELRTPLAELRTIAQVSLPEAQPGSEAAAALRDVQAAAQQMDRMVTALLALARCEGGRQTVQLEPVDLPAVLAEAWAPLESTAAARRLRIQLPRLEGTRGPTVQADRALLASMLSNLLSNAVNYTPAGEMVTVSISATADRLELQLENVQRELSAGDLDHLFDPFWRKDPARTGGNHAGLGLTLVAAFARLMAVDLVVSLPHPDRLRFVLSFPRFKD